MWTKLTWLNPKLRNFWLFMTDKYRINSQKL